LNLFIMASIDIEAANRLRVAMGLKPIEMQGGPVFKQANGSQDEELPSTVETRQAMAGDNWLKKQQDEESKAKRKAQKEAIKKARDAAMRDAKMTGKTLGDADEDLDTASWLRQQNKRQKKIEKARKLEEELAAREKQAEYSSKDLAGVKVAHELDQFDAGAEQILTLKDAVIGDESEDDELENAELRANERLQEKLERKKRKPVYNPNDDEEGNGERGVLAQYDEEITGKKQAKFTLDGFGSTKEQASRDAEDADQKSKGIVISLDILKDDKPVSDYIELSEIKMRKPKKKSKSTRKKKAEDDDIFPINDNAMDIDSPASNFIPHPKKRTFDDVNFVDDDDLQARLAQQRREALKKKRRVAPEDMARQLREEELNKMDVTESVEDAAGGLVFDETREFVDHLEAPADREEQAQPASRARSKSAKRQSPESDEDVEMRDDKPVGAESEEGVEPESKNGGHAVPETSGFEEDSSMDRGIGSTLSLLRQRRLIEGDGGDSNIADKMRGYDKFLAKKKLLEENYDREAKIQRERDRQSGRLDRMSAQEREEYARHSNVRREQMLARGLADLYAKEYKPDTRITYHDVESGRQMNQKEAFKELSHKFHGKGSGKEKHEKKLKKIAEEKKREAMSTLDSSQHVSSAAMGSKAKKNQQAGVRLQ
jgi:U4/U6.U5 tri-snRNP-associated protein 1